MLIERERKEYNQNYEALYKKTADMNMDKNLQNKDGKLYQHNTSRKRTFRPGLLSRPSPEPGQMGRPRRPEITEKVRGLLSRFFKAFCPG
jgi:hypothetical protein